VIKARLDGVDDPTKHVAVFGLTAENMFRLQEGKPIAFNLSDIGLPSQAIVIVGGTDEKSIIEHIKKEFGQR
jgi:hypothetical protein